LLSTKRIGTALKQCAGVAMRYFGEAIYLNDFFIHKNCG